MVFSKAALLSLAASPASAFFLIPAWPLSRQRLDPIVNNGSVANHVHHIVGGNAFAPSMNYESTQQSTCTSSMVSKDKSNYWVSQLYHKNADGTFDIVEPVGSMSLYYLNEPTRLGSDKEMKAFPKGFRMLVGHPDRRSDDGTIPKGAINFKCLDFASGLNKDFDTMPDIDCGTGVRSEITFPSCWDGVNLDSEDHRSHVAYPTGTFESGTCPESHPVHMVVLKSEQIWKTGDFPVNGKNPFVWSTGDVEGHGYHADFLNGWEDGVLQKAVDECQDTSGMIEKCPVFAGMIPTERQYLDPGTCKVESFVEEQVDGPLNALPGCNAISYGPGSRKRENCGDTVGLKSGWTDVGSDGPSFGGAFKSGVDAVTSAVGGIFPGADSPAGTGNGYGAPVPTVAPAQFYETPDNNGGKKTVTTWTTVTETTTVTGSPPAGTNVWNDAKKREVEHVHKHRNAHKRGSF